MRTIYKDPDRYVNQYWSKFPELPYWRSAKRDETDIIGSLARGWCLKVLVPLGQRNWKCVGKPPGSCRGTAIGLPTKWKEMQSMHMWYWRQESKKAKTIEELRQHVSHEMGPIAKPEHIEFVESLPKTRSGKSCEEYSKQERWAGTEGYYDIGRIAEIFECCLIDLWYYFIRYAGTIVKQISSFLMEECYLDILQFEYIISEKKALKWKSSSRQRWYGGLLWYNCRPIQISTGSEIFSRGITSSPDDTVTVRMVRSKPIDDA